MKILENEFFAGKAFLPWNRMGNLKTWSGPLTMKEMKKDAELQHQILKRLKNLGITPVVPSFNGIVPSELLEIFPNETFYPLKSL